MQKRRVLVGATLVLVGAVAGQLLVDRLRSAEPDVTAAGAPETADAAAQPAGAAALQSGPDFTRVAAATVDAVTNISSITPVQRPRSPFADDPFFRYFFGDGDVFGRSRPELSLGSGVIVSPDGYVLTNVHVLGTLGRGTEVSVTLADKRELRAQIIGIDELTDIALLKIDATGLRTIPWGDSTRLKVAEWVLAIGNPFQLSQTVTLGIVSALGRSNIGAASYEDFIQTDAAINPGNSGGALINSRGELIGINTAIYSTTQGYQGIGFAVPSALARRVMDDLIAHGEVRRGSIGYVETLSLTTPLAQQIGVTQTTGILVTRMERSSPAYQAGLRPRDIILTFNGTEVTDPGQFARLVADAEIGSTARLTVLRDGGRETIALPIEQSMRRRVRGR